MPHSDRGNSNDPLLGGPPKLASDPAHHAISPLNQTAIKVLAAIRVVTGAACLIAPRYTCALFRYIVPAEHTLLVRMVGARDVVFGELLITAEDKNREDGGRRQVHEE